MIEKINNGDQEALKAFLQMYAQHILDRATLRMASAQHAREATRLAVLAIVEAAKRGEVPLEVIPWLNRLTDESCERLSRLMRGEAEKPAPASKPQTGAQQVKPAQPVQSAAQQPRPVQSAAQQPRPAQSAAQQARPTQSAAQQPRPVQSAAQNAQPVQSAAQQTQPAQSAAQQPRPAQSAAQRSAYGQAPTAEDYKDPARAAQRELLPVIALNADPAAAGAQICPASAPQAEAAMPRPHTAAEKRPAAPQGTPTLFEEEEAAAPVRSKKRRRDKDDAKVGTVFLVFFLVLVVLALIWMLLVMLMSKGYLPVMDFGFADWFNANVFQLF